MLLYHVSLGRKKNQAETVVRNFPIKKKFLKFCSSHRKTPVLESLFKVKMQAFRPAVFLKSDSHRYFPVNFVKFVKTPTLCNICKWLILIKGEFYTMLFFELQFTLLIIPFSVFWHMKIIIRDELRVLVAFVQFKRKTHMEEYYIL